VSVGDTITHIQINNRSFSFLLTLTYSVVSLPHSVSREIKGDPRQSESTTKQRGTKNQRRQERCKETHEEERQH
jgi:hypothetical protein